MTALSSVGHMIIHEDPTSPDESTADGDTITESPTSSSSTLILNSSQDSSDINDISDNKEGILQGAAAALAFPHILNVDETGTLFRPIRARMTGLFGQNERGRSFRPIIFRDKFGFVASNSDDSTMPLLEEGKPQGTAFASDSDDSDVPPSVENPKKNKEDIWKQTSSALM